MGHPGVLGTAMGSSQPPGVLPMIWGAAALPGETLLLISR